MPYSVMTLLPHSSQASPKLSLFGAALIGIASMLGAGVFAVFPPAAKLAGSYLLAAIVLAGIVAILNARSMRQLSAVYSDAGGAYSYGRIFISDQIGFLAGAAFVLGKIGSVAAVALAAASYLYPTAKVQVAVLAVLVMTVINILGINRTALGALILSIPTISLLVLISISGLMATPTQNPIDSDFSITGVISAAALIFFAFAGYARVATLGEEVSNPLKNVPRAIAISLTVVLILYLFVGYSLQSRLGANLEISLAPILDYSNIFLPQLSGELVIVIAAAACLGSLLSLLAGISRTAAAMAKNNDLPKVLAVRSNRFASPFVADLFIAAVAISLLSLGDLVWTIGISSFATLLYYGIANWAAFRQAKATSVRQQGFSLLGLISCLLLAVSVPLGSLILAASALASALLIRVWFRSWLRRISRKS